MHVFMGPLFVWLICAAAVVVVEGYRFTTVVRRLRHALGTSRRLSQPLVRSSTSLAVLRDNSGAAADDEIEFSSQEGFTYKRKKGGDASTAFKKADNRDSLPFVVTFDEGKGKLMEIGTFLLDASTACGDLLDLGGRLFEVQKVSFLYKYESGGFRVFKKKLDVSTAKASWVGVSDTTDTGAGAETDEGGTFFLQ